MNGRSTNGIETTIEERVGSSADAFLGVVADLETLASWMTNVVAVEGSDYERARVREWLGRRTGRFDVECVLRTPSEVVLQATRRPFSFVARFSALSTLDGTRVQYRRRATPTTRVTVVLFKLAGGLLKRAWPSAMRREVRRAAELAERRDEEARVGSADPDPGRRR